MLSVAAIAAPPAAFLAVFLRDARPLSDTVVVMGIGLGLPALRIAPRASFALRGATTIALLAIGGTYVAAHSGLAPGVALLFVLASTVGAVCFGRTVGFAVVAYGALVFLVLGWLIAHGALAAPPGDFAPTLFRNWFRVGAIFALLGGLIASAISFVIRRVESNARDLRVAYERLGQLHLRLESTKEDERRFLAHELHDELGQSLTALKLQIATRRGSNPGAAHPSDAAALKLIDELIGRIRQMSGDLRPPLLDEVGLVPALRAFLVAQASLSGVAMTLDADEPPGTSRLPPDLEITCFRIVQEAITNAIRHADARDLRVRLEREPDRVALRIVDDGRGFDVGVRLENAAAAGHLGVVGMRERVRAHGGGFAMRSRPGAGTTIEVVLPIRAGAGPSVAAALPS